MSSFYRELKRRNVVKVGVAYAVVGWILIEVASVLMPAFGAPDWVFRIFALLIALGFPVAIIFAWAFELTPEGLRRTEDVPVDQSITAKTGQTLNRSIIGLLVVALAISLYVNFRDTGPTEENKVASAQEEQKAIAVLPFSNLSGSDKNEPFTLGIHDDLLTHLSKIHSLRTISRTSVLQYRDTDKTIPQIASELGVSSIVEGGIQRAGDRVRINVQLIDAKSDEHLWAETYDRQLTAENIFAIQSEIASEIAAALKATLTPEEQARLDNVGTESLEAYDLYLQGRYLFHRRGVEEVPQSIEKLKAAVELDPDFAAAWSTLAMAYGVLPAWADVDRNETDPLAREAARRALELDPSLGEPHAILAGINEERWNWVESEQGFRKVLELEPGNAQARQWYAELLSESGRVTAALEQSEYAARFDPVSGNINVILAGSFLRAGRYQEAWERIDRAVALVGEREHMRRLKGAILVHENRYHEALEFFEARQQEAHHIWPLPVLYALQDPGRRAEALTYLNNAIDADELNWNDALTYFVLLGDVAGGYDLAFDMIEDRELTLRTLWNRGLSTFRRDPRFVDLMRQTGLPAYWEKFGWPDLCEPAGDTFSCS